MVHLRSKKGHIATAMFSFFFSFFVYFFFFLTNARFSSISHKPLEINFPNLNMFVRKNVCSKKFPPPFLKNRPWGQKVRKHMSRMIGRTVSPFVANFYLKVPRVSAFNLFQKKFNISI